MLKDLVKLESLIDAFDGTAKQFADHDAVVHGEDRITYADLDRLSDAVATQLLAAGAEAGSLVGVSAQNDPVTIIALLAILKAGAGYVPLPDYYPDERLRLIAGEAGIRMVIGPVPALEQDGVVRIDFDWHCNRDATKPAAHPVRDRDQVAYVMYTSGSTGTPKGVVVPHRAILRLVRNQNFMTLGDGERILQASPIAFDAATLEIWGALLNGGTLVLPDAPTTSLRDLGDMLRRHRITTLWLTAGLFHAMADERPGDFAPLRQLLTGGDVVSPAKVAKVMALCPDLNVINGYGPTENTTFTCCHRIARAEADSGVALPIGRPISGTDIFVLDDRLHPVPEGGPGELCASGDGLALGYLGRPDLTAEKFVPAPWDPAVTLYRTGDLVRQDAQGVVHYLGRIDTQVKVRGYRIELGEIEIALETWPGIRQAVVIARPGRDAADKTLIAYLVADSEPDEAALRAHLALKLPDYSIPARFLALGKLPLNDNGKVDRRALQAMPIPKMKGAFETRRASSAHTIEDIIGDALADALGVESADLDRNANFFDLGASSLHVARVHERLQTALGQDFPIADFFMYSSIATMARYLSKTEAPMVKSDLAAMPRAAAGSDLIAIVGLAGRFPGAPDVETFWDGLVNGREMISQFSREDLECDLSGSDPNGHFVNARGVMPDADMFDARHFNIPPREAERMDPQHRILLEVAQTALDNAGHDPARFPGKIGIFAGSSQNSYLLNNLLSAPGASRAFAANYPLDDFSTLFGNDKDFIATRIAYKLNLRGPAATVLCACSTSLVAVAQGCESLRRGTSDMVLAGGVSVTFPSRRNYKYMPDGMASADGHCRTFDAEATGTVFGDGAGLVVLRRLEDALADGDEVIAIIRGYSINNDGSEKAGYAAPSIRAQADVIRAAQVAAGVAPHEIGYIEAHGTATPLGDPIEFAALHQAFSAETQERGFCALGSAKTNVGHLDIAAGVTGLIKAALTLKHGVIPPLLHYKSPNPRIDFANSAFYPVSKLTPWPASETPRRAGVSAFGVGGTNIHVILEEAPVREPAEGPAAPGPRVFPVSGSSPEALAAMVSQLGQWAAAHPEADPDAVLATLRSGRRTYNERAVLVADDLAGVAAAAAGFAGKPVTAGRRDAIAFLFPGQGAQHVGMARDLYAAEPVFREALGLCAKLLEPELGLNLIDVIHAPEDQRETMTERLKDTALAQPAIFSIGYALAKQWDHWGIRPDAMIGHSIGEFAAATVAGVMELRDALKLIALRGRLMADLPRGVMVAVRAAEADLAPWLGAGLDLAAVNGAKACVLAGSEAAAAAILPQIEAAGIVTSRLHTSHAFHSEMMEPALAPFREAVAKLTLRAPRIPILSTVTGDWLTDSEATDPDYWANHMRRPVRFYDAIQVLWAEARHIFLETGPGRTMSVLAGQNPDRRAAQPALASLPHATAEQANSQHSMLEAFGLLWANGYPVDWTRIDPARPDGVPARRASGLPTYPFQRKRFWVEPFDTASLRPAALAGPSDDSVATAESPATGPQVSAADALREMLADLSGIDPADMDGAATFLELGFDSLLLTQATRELSERFGVAVTLRELIDGLPNIDALAAHVDAHGTLAGTTPPDRTPLAELTRIETEDETASATPSSAPMTRIARETEELTPQQRAGIDALTARFTAKTAQSKALTRKHRAHHADPRTASGFNRLWKELVYQIVTVKSKGSRLIDVDGNEYIDILNGFGPGFLGHSPDNVVRAIENQLHAGFEVGPQSLAAMEAAELFCEVTGNDRASFVCTGSEAVYAAMRLARTVTSRDRIVMFARDYHGNFDEVLVRGIDGKDGPRTLPLAPGIPRDAVKNVVVLPYGSPQALDYIRKNADSLAAVIVEPVQSRRPEFRPADFIREVRRITEKSGTLFIFDEVVTGFRFGPRGAQGYYGVKADLVTYGKVVGGGMPVGVVSGQARYMDTFDGGMWDYGDDSFPSAPVTFFAGTFVRHPLAMASLKAMLTFLKAQPDFFWKTVNAKGDRLAGTIDRWFVDNDMPFQMPNCGSLMYLRIGEDQKFGALIGAHLRDRGVFLLEGFPSYMTAAHDDADIDHVIDAMMDSALEMRAAGLLTGREAMAYDGPRIDHAPPRLSLPDGEAKIAAAMNAPPGSLSIPTTEAQREIWAAMIVTADAAAAYNESVTLKLAGKVDRDALLAAVRLSLRRHDALRSTFAADGLTMHIHPDLTVEVPLVDLAGQSTAEQQASLQAILAAEVEVPFDMVAGPFVRAHLVALAPDKHHLLITAHHIVCDGWSIDVIMRDIGAIYTALQEGRDPALPPPDSIIDYARAEVEWSQSDAARAAREYWKGQFADGILELDLPTDRPRPPVRTVAARRIDAMFDPSLVARLRRTAASQKSTLVNLLLAGFELYLARITGAADVTVGVPAAGQASRAMEGLVGHCVNLMPLRTHVDRNEVFSSYLKQMRGVMLDGAEHQHFSYGAIVRELKVARDPSRIPITPVMFNIDNGIDLSDMRFGDATTEFVSNPRAFENFEIFLNVTNGRETVLAEWTYNTDLFDAATIDGHMAGLSALLERIAENPEAEVGDLLALSETEIALLADAAEGPSAVYPALPLPALVAAQAARAPHASAIEVDGRVTSYGELDALANQIANELVARGVRPGDRVGVSLSRDARLVAALLGVMKAGGAYVPLDPGFPRDRLLYMLSSCGAAHILTDATTRELFDGSGEVRTLDLDAEAAAVAARPSLPPDPALSPDSLAYVLYTSGSTGQPKGVAVSHRAFVNFITAMAREPGLKPGDRLLAVTTISFDIAGLEIWGPLTVGGTVVMAGRGDAFDAERLRRLLDSENIDVLQATPTTWRMLFESGWAGSQRLTAMVGGEALPADLARELAERCGAAWNMYGPTETTVWSTLKRLDGGRLTIGRPIANTEIAILDEAMRPVPPGVGGELYIGGHGLAEGYLGREDLTSDRFVAHPGKAGQRLYRTGDLARWVSVGTGFEIDCLGRIDNQIKLRGYRIELGEIEAALADQPAVSQAVVLVREFGPGDDRLVAFLTTEGATPDAADLRAALSARLPAYMVPSRFEVLESLPLTPNGKVDRKALATQSLSGVAEPAPVAGGTLDRLLGLFREVLKQDEVGPGQSFFELGGHSLLAIKLFARVREEFGRDLPVSTLFVHPTARLLAAQIVDDDAGRDRPEPAVDAPDTQPSAPMAGGTLDRILAIFRDVLKQDDVSPGQSFFEMGGHSLLAIKLFARLRDEFDRDLVISMLFDNPTAQLLAAQIGEDAGPARPKPVAEQGTAAGGTARPVSSATTEGQREIFGAMLFDPEQNQAYNLPFSLEIDGRLDVEAMLAALTDLLLRHDVLRARFEDSGLSMVFGTPDGSEVSFVDLAALPPGPGRERLDLLRSEFANWTFDLSGGPLFLARIVRLGPDRHEIIFCTHHIVCDGWSINVILEDLRALYLARTGQARTSLPAPTSIAELVVAEVDWNKSPAARDSLAYWKSRFADGVPLIDLAAGRPRSAVKTAAGAQADGSLDAQLSARVAKMAQKFGTTVENVILAAFNLFVSRTTGSAEVVLGMPSAGQLSYGLEQAVGHSVNFLPIRNSVKPDESFATLVDRVRKTQLEVLDHNKMSFSALLPWLKLPRDRSRVVMVPVAITFENVIGQGGMEYPGLDARLVWHPRPFEHFELFVYVTVGAERIVMDWSYGTDVFSADNIAGQIEHFTDLLRQLAADTLGVDAVVPVSQQADTVVEHGRLAGPVVDFPRDETLATLFAAQVRQNPLAPALIQGGTKVPYRDLDLVANAIARRLKARGVVAGDLVGVSLERSTFLVAAILAVLRLGAAYVALDPSNPTARLRHIAEDSRTRLVVTKTSLAERIGFTSTLILDDLNETEIVNAEPMAPVVVNPQAVAYVTYTSGSTGAPKGVTGTHRATINRFHWMWRCFPFVDGEVMCQKTRLSFVDSVWEILGPLLAGVPQVLIHEETVLDPAKLIRKIGEHGVTRLLLVPSLLRAILDSEIDVAKHAPSLRWIFSSGERLTKGLAERLHRAAPKVTLVNLYGSSEVAGDVTYEILGTIDTDEVPIGRGIDNALLYVLDEDGRPVPSGEVGELHVGGEVLASGYLHRPDLTSKRFLPDPFAASLDAVMFATGDRVSTLPDGRLMFHGRTDSQVKIRGARVELDEVDVAFRALPGVAQAVTVAAPDSQGEMCLTTFVTSADGVTLEARALRSAAALWLPSFMIPTRIETLASMPLNPNGKVDRQALSGLASAVRVTPQAPEPLRTQPTSEVEVALKQIWEKTLGLSDIGMDDDYFELGGHSLMAVKLFAAVKSKFKVNLPIATLMNHPTVRGLAEQISVAKDASIRGASPSVVHRGAPKDAPWDTTVVINAGPGGDARPLFIVGGIGGNVNNLFELGKAIGRFRPVIGLQTRGILGHNPHDTIEAVSADHVANIRRHQPEGPYLLAGYSGGAYSAFEMARQLVADSQAVDFVGILDMSAPGFEVDTSMPIGTRLRREIKALGEGGLKPFLARLRPKLRDTILSDRALSVIGLFRPQQTHLQKLARNSARICGSYRPKRYSGDVTLFVASDPRGFEQQMMLAADSTYGWSDLVDGRMELENISGDHFDFLIGEGARDLAERIERSIAAAGRSD